MADVLLDDGLDIHAANPWRGISRDSRIEGSKDRRIEGSKAISGSGAKLKQSPSTVCRTKLLELSGVSFFYAWLQDQA